MKDRKIIQIPPKFQTLNQIRRNASKEYGLDYHEALEMSYENLKWQYDKLCKDYVNAMRGE